MTSYFSSVEWDDRKAEINARKHGITFEEAETVFDDYYARVIPDEEHSALEDRFIILGLSVPANVLVVCHCYREGGQVLRIISARRATKSEEKTYWRFRDEGRV